VLPYCSPFSDYPALCGNQPGAIFITQYGNPVTREVFAAWLSEAIKFCGLNPTRYKSHSFRIGAASYAAEKGMSNAQICTLGRWKSNYFQKYIRVSSLST
jgi:site-specific recombinase XerD